MTFGVSAVLLIAILALAVPSALGEKAPFSFVYGGKHSSSFLSSWKKVAGQGVTVWRDPETGLEVQVRSKTYKDTGGNDWTVVFTNKGTKPTPIIEQVFALDLEYAVSKGDVVHHGIHGSLGPNTTWIPYDTAMPVGSSIELSAPTGRPAETVGPFFNVQWPGGGTVTAVGWSGCWQAYVSRPTETTVKIQAGMKYCHLSLNPGESIRTPRIVQLPWKGNDESEAYVKWRRMMLKHFHPHSKGKPIMPPIVRVGPDIDAFPFDKMNEYSEAAVLKEIADVSSHGFEYCWVDAYFTKGGFPEGVGNYALPVNSIADPIRFPRGLAPIADAAHKAGLKFLLWFEPERVVPGTYIAKQHPELVISTDGSGGGMFNLGDPQAREYMTNVLSTAISEWKMDCLRIDYNYHPLPYWQHENAKDPNRVGIAEIRYVEGLHRLCDDLLRLHPSLMIDNCASGGTRIEIELCSRSIPLWRTDDTIGPFFDRNYNRVSILNQSMSAGLNRYVPFSISGGIGTDPYNFRSGFNGGICPIDAPGPEKHAELRAAIAEGKRLRKYYLGDYYSLAPVDQDAEHWCAMQFNRPKERDGMAVLFRRETCLSDGFSLSGLHGIDPSAVYSAWVSYGYERGKAITMKGSELLGLKVKVEAKPGSVVVEYRMLLR